MIVLCSVCNDPYCPFPYQGSKAEEHRKAYHSPIRNFEWGGVLLVLDMLLDLTEHIGKLVEVRRRIDMKVPCPCGDESHARYSVIKLYSVMRNHPPPGIVRPFSAPEDVSFDIDVPPRPTSDPVDPTTFINVNAFVAPVPSVSPAHSSGGQEPSQLSDSSLLFDTQQLPEETVRTVDTHVPAFGRSTTANKEDLNAVIEDMMDVDSDTDGPEDEGDDNGQESVTNCA